MNAAEILEYANQHDVRLWADGNLLRINAPREIMTPEFQGDLKRHKSDLIRTLTDPSETDRKVQENLRNGVPTLVNLWGIGRAYWVADEVKRDELQATLLAQGDDTPIFASDELDRIKDWPLEDKRNAYEFKRRFQGEIRKSEIGADG